MDRARPVRIARRPRPSAAPPPVPAIAPPLPTPLPSPEPARSPGEYRENRGGTQRAARLFGLYLVAVLALYAGLLALLARGPGGVGSNLPLLGLLAVLGVAIGVVGWQVTLGQTPRGVWVDGSRLLVRERFGRQRELADPAGKDLVVARRYPANWLIPESTLLVRVKDATGLSRVYLVGLSLLPGTEPP